MIRICLLTIIFVQAFGIWCPVQGAGVMPSLDLAQVTGQPGETVRVPLTLTNVSGYQVAAVSTDISYDDGVLENPGAHIGPAGSAAGKSVIFKEVSPGIFRVGVSGFNQNLIRDGVVAYAIFDVKAETALGKTILYNSPSGSDPSGNDVPVEGQEGAVSVMTVLYVSHDGACVGHGPCFVSIQAAIDEAESVTLIMVAEGTFEEDLVMDQPRKITVQGGWDPTFTDRESNTVVSSMRIGAGTATIQYLVIR